MSTDNLTPPAASVWPPPPTNTQDDGRSRLRALLARYRSPTPLSRWMLGFMAATVLANVVEMMGFMSGSSGFRFADHVEAISSLVTLPAGVIALIWIYRLYKNLTSFGVSRLRYSPGAAVAMCILPIVNIYMPHVIMTEIWRAASPQTVIDNANGRWAKTASTSLISFWWIGYLAYSLSTTLAAYGGAKTPSDVAMCGIAALVSVVSGGLFALLALRVNKRQEQRYEEIAASLEID